jgi:hypothetical protein
MTRDYSRMKHLSMYRTGQTNATGDREGLITKRKIIETLVGHGLSVIESNRVLDTVHGAI